MASVTTAQARLFISACSVGPLEAAHFKVVMDAIAGSTPTTPTFRLERFLSQLRASGVLGEEDAERILAALEAAAAAGAAVNLGGVDARIRARRSFRRLRAVLPQDVVEGLIASVITAEV